MFAKLEIKVTIELLTGMHIGGSTQFAAIGAIDSPVMRDVFSDLPMIPGSSLKGKMRTLMAKKYSPQLKSHDNDPAVIRRLFGSSNKENIEASRLIFSDAFISNEKELKEIGISTTEIKVENTINRSTAVANPRQIERAVRGSEFEFRIVYNADKEEEIIEDMKLLKEGLKFLEYDYIGGHGSRGYGRIGIKNLGVELVVGDLDKKVVSECKNIIEDK